MFEPYLEVRLYIRTIIDFLRTSTGIINAAAGNPEIRKSVPGVEQQQHRKTPPNDTHSLTAARSTEHTAAGEERGHTLLGHLQWTWTPGHRRQPHFSFLLVGLQLVLHTFKYFQVCTKLCIWDLRSGEKFGKVTTVIRRQSSSQRGADGGSPFWEDKTPPLSSPWEYLGGS